MRPLYSEAKERKIDWQGGNTGLWYDKFCDQWKPDWSDLGDDGKKDWINTVTGRPCGDSEQLGEARGRMERLLEAHVQPPLFYKLESDFVTGLGREHPVENGFAWHHTLGTPYLPGSSVKGMVRAWAEGWEGTNKATLKRIFGSESKEDRDFQVGSVIFLDALPTKAMQLKADIMTPHYGPYYQDDKGHTPPADWHSPTPIPFLVVEAGATFQFGVLPRCQDAEADCEHVREWLKEALCWTGAGAKTAVGYGRFEVDDDMQKAARRKLEENLRKQQEREAEEKRQAELEQMSPILREMHEDGYETGEFISAPMQKWLERLGKAEGKEKLEIAQQLKAWYLKHRADQWSKPNKKNAEKIAPIKRVLGEP